MEELRSKVIISLSPFTMAKKKKKKAKKSKKRRR